MMAICPVCGRMKCIHRPEHWEYRRGSTYYCCEQCMDTDLYRDMQLLNAVNRRKRKEIIMTKITLEQKKKAVEIAISGGNPLEYLKKCGSKKPDGLWYTIKENLKKVDPETYAKIPDFRGKSRTAKEPKTAGEAMEAAKDAADEFFGKCEDMGLKMETPTVKVDGPLRIQTEEPEKVKIISEQNPLKPGLRGLNNSDFEVSAIKHPIFGEFYYDQKFGMVDWRTPDGEEVSLSPKNWKELYLIIPDIMGILQVVDDDE